MGGYSEYSFAVVTHSSVCLAGASEIRCADVQSIAESNGLILSLF